MKIARIVFYVIVAVVLIFVVISTFFRDNPDIGVNAGLTLAYILGIGATAAALVFAIINLVKHPKTAIRTLAGVIILAVVFVLGYVMSGSEVTMVYENNGVTTPGASKFIGGVLKTMYILFIGVFVLAVFSEVRKIFK